MDDPEALSWIASTPCLREGTRNSAPAVFLPGGILGSEFLGYWKGGIGVAAALAGAGGAGWPCVLFISIVHVLVE